MKGNDLTNKQFGRLKVLRYLFTNKNGNHVWECLCKCGNIIQIEGVQLTRKNGTRTCKNCHVIDGKNDIPSIAPWMKKYFKNQEDIYKYTYGSSKKVLVKCPDCGERMNVKTLSNRYTKSGDLRFNYRCRKRMEDRFGCTSKDINGNELDQFVIDTISHMNCPDDRYYAQLQNLRDELLKAQREELKEIKGLEKELDKIGSGIAAQMENLRHSGLNDDDKSLIWDDIHALQEQKKAITGKIELITKQMNNEVYSLEQIEEVKSKIKTFPQLMELATYEQKIELIRKIVNHIVVKHNDTTGDDDVHIVLCGAENTVNFNLAPERRVMCHSGIDSIINTPCGVGCKADALIGLERRNCLD